MKDAHIQTNSIKYIFYVFCRNSNLSNFLRTTFYEATVFLEYLGLVLFPEDEI